MTASEDDWALWQRARCGDAAAASGLVRRLAPQALALARQMLGRSADAEDVVQASFLRLWDSRAEGGHGAALATYFNTIVLNRCRSQLLRQREQATEPTALIDLADTQLQAQAPPLPASVDAGRLRIAMQALPARQRMALAMWAYADATAAEIAGAFGIEVNAAHQLLHRARQALRQQLAPAEAGASPPAPASPQPTPRAVQRTRP